MKNRDRIKKDSIFIVLIIIAFFIFNILNFFSESQNDKLKLASRDISSYNTTFYLVLFDKNREIKLTDYKLTITQLKNVRIFLNIKDTIKGKLFLNFYLNGDFIHRIVLKNNYLGKKIYVKFPRLYKSGEWQIELITQDSIFIDIINFEVF